MQLLKVDVECAPCLLRRGCMEILEATDNKILQFEAISALMSLLNREFHSNAVSAVLATERDRIVKAVTGNADPYARKKQLSNLHALKILPQVKRLIALENSSEARFRRACLCAIVGNIIEFGIPEHEFRFEDIGKMMLKAQQDLAIDDLSDIFKVAKTAGEILYLTDNAGEIAFDTVLVTELKKLGAHVTVAVKEKPVINDATLLDANTVGMQEIADVVTTGADTVGLITQKCSKSFLSLYKSADLVIAKGMGHAETLTETEVEKPHGLLLRTKCSPVARQFGTVWGKNVAKLMI